MTTWKLTPKGEAMANQLSLELANPCQKGTKEWEQWIQGAQDAIAIKPPAQPFPAYLEGFQWGINYLAEAIPPSPDTYKDSPIEQSMRAFKPMVDRLDLDAKIAIYQAIHASSDTLPTDEMIMLGLAIKFNGQFSQWLARQSRPS